MLDTGPKEPGKGGVLVIDAGGSARRAVLGDRMAGQAVENGWTGVVRPVATRDSEEPDAMDVDVLAVGTSPRKSARAGRRSPRSHSALRRAASPGDRVHDDADGVLGPRDGLGRKRASPSLRPHHPGHASIIGRRIAIGCWRRLSLSAR